MKKPLRIAVGIICIIIGLIGFLVPVVPGFALLFVGLELAGIGFLIPSFVRRFLSDLYRKWKPWRRNGKTNM
ncbi:MAG: hypothetical protein PHZ00_00935 [Candidatus Peribacteraceae bacterium]|nr:hypothetical protein [Candidatus Peribacteraceae bacterium]